MSEINYWELENQIGQLIKEELPVIGDNQLPVNIFIEEPLNLVTSRGHQVYIYIDTWETAEDDEYIAAGTHFRTFVNFQLWLYVHGLESKIACQNRDRFLQKVKEVFKKPSNRQLSGKAQMVTFAGGDFDNQKDGGGFWKGVSVNLRIEVRE
jgi:hypothetical protein